MGVRRDWQAATFAIGGVVMGLLFGLWVYSRMGHSDWVILLEIPIAIWTIVSIGGFAEGMEKKMRDHKGKAING